MRSPALLYIIGVAAIGFGFYQFWRDAVVNQEAFLVGGVCLASGAGLQVLRDLWRRLRR